MIRFVTLLCAALAAGSGFFLYTKKHETLVLDQSIRQTINDTRQIQQQTAMLRTQWALLNQPDRLSVLAKRVLPELAQVDPAQFVQLANLREKLPAIDHRIIPMPLARQQAQQHLAALTAPPPAPSPGSRPERETASSTAHHNGHTHMREKNENATNQSLEQSLALLSSQDGSTASHHHHHAGEGNSRRKTHTTPAHTHSEPTSSQAEDVVWHPAPRREGRHPHMSGIHTASASTDEQAPLPPPTPLTN